MKVRRSVTLWLFACLVVACWHGAARGQQVSAVAGVSERERGIELYKAGNVKGAIAALKTATKQSKTDADAWYYLGVALNDDKKPKDARKAFERAAKLRPDFTGTTSASR